MNHPRRGELWMVEWSPGRGSEQLGPLPALVVQCDPVNLQTRYTNTIVLALTSRFHGQPTHVEIHPTAANGLAVTSYVLCEQIMTISKERMERRLGVITPEGMALVQRAVRRMLAL